MKRRPVWSLPRPATCALWLLPILAAAAGPAAAQSGQVSPAAYAIIMKSESFGIRSYKGAAGEKALAACINWSQSKGDRSHR